MCNPLRRATVLLRVLTAFSGSAVTCTIGSGDRQLHTERVGDNPSAKPEPTAPLLRVSRYLTSGPRLAFYVDPNIYY